MVSSEEIRFLYIPKDSIRKKKCGCIETKCSILGSDLWVCHLDGYCVKHIKETRREFEKQHEQEKINRKPKRKAKN